MDVNYVMRCNHCMVCYLCETVQEKEQLENKPCRLCSSTNCISAWSEVDASKKVK